MSNDNGNDTRILYGAMQADGAMEYRTNLTHKSRTGPVVLLHDLRPVIPIVFMPGIMATRLRLKDSGDPVWNPPNTLGDIIKAFFNYAFKTSAARIKELKPENVEVATELPANVELRKQYPESALRREEKGWGAVYASSYHGFMGYIEQTLNQALYAREELPDENIKETLRVPQLPEEFKADPQEYGALDWAAEPLTQEEFGKAIGKYRYDVWGCGYNWLQSNRQSAADVWKRIGEILKTYPEGTINKQKRVILITHSMGGVVARSLYAEYEAKCGEQDKRIWGVIHIAQPAAGAPTVYRRMRAGDTGAVKILTGRNAADVTGILAQAHGGLELLPFPHYDQRHPWLTCTKEANHPGNALELPPKGGDPYNSIYKNPAWYGLLPDQNLKLVLGDMEATADNLKKVRSDFEDTIDDVQTFHKSITGTYHPVTYAIWGESLDQPAWRRLSWEQSKKRYMTDEERMFDSPDLRDSGKGSVDEGDYHNQLYEFEVPGDSTVPGSAARDQQFNAKVCFIQGDGSGKHNDKHGWSHQDACNDRRTQWAAIYSIVKLVSKSCP